MTFARCQICDKFIDEPLHVYLPDVIKTCEACYGLCLFSKTLEGAIETAKRITTLNTPDFPYVWAIQVREASDLKTINIVIQMFNDRSSVKYRGYLRLLHLIDFEGSVYAILGNLEGRNTTSGFLLKHLWYLDIYDGNGMPQHMKGCKDYVWHPDRDKIPELRKRYWDQNPETTLEIFMAV